MASKLQRMLNSYPIDSYQPFPQRLSWVERKRLKNVGKARENIFEDGYKGKIKKVKWFRRKK